MRSGYSRDACLRTAITMTFKKKKHRMVWIVFQQGCGHSERKLIRADRIKKVRKLCTNILCLKCQNES
jgi:hypothetical protein